MRYLYTTLFVFFMLLENACAQSIAINTDGSSAATSAILDVKSTVKGMLLPRMSKAQRNAISSPATGLLVFQNAPDSSGFYYYNGTAWNWINNPTPPDLWSIHGNSGTSESSDFIGTTDYKDLIFRTQNVEFMRLTKEANLGIGMIPRYGLDLSFGMGAINYCNQNGLRIKNWNMPSDCETGLMLGYTAPLGISDDAILWNYGSGSSSVKNLILGVGGYERMRVNSNGLVGLGQPDPSYTLDINAGNAAVNPCYRNGLRINHPTYGNGCDKGLFLGFDNMSGLTNSSLWNFADPSSGVCMRFGFGTVFDNSIPDGESMRILPPGKGIGVGTTQPMAMLHIRNTTGTGVLPGVMVTNPTAPAGEYGFYTGLQMGINDDGRIWNYQDASILFGTANMERMAIIANGNVGIGESFPAEKLHVGGNIRAFGLAGTGYRVVGATSNGTLTATTGNDGEILTTVAGSATWQVHPGWSVNGNAGTSPATQFLGTTDPADLIIRTNNVETARFTGTGNAGVGTDNPVEKFEVVGSSIGTPVKAVIANRIGFGPAALELVSDYGFPGQWRPGYIRSNDLGGFTGAVEIYTNGTGVGNRYGSVKGFEVRNGAAYTATGTVNTWSDIRLKKDIQPFKAGLDVIKQINPVSFYYNEEAPFKTDKMQIGVVAQELEQEAPYMVEKNVAGNVQDLRSVNNQAYIYLLINAVKEQDKKIEALQKQLEEQKKLIDKLIK